MSNRVHNLKNLISKAVEPTLRHAGAMDPALILQWQSIVGEKLAKNAIPHKIVYPQGIDSRATLHVQVKSGAFATLFMHQETQIIEKINQYFGYQAVGRIVTMQMPFRQYSTDNLPVPLSLKHKNDVEDEIKTVEDPELRAILERLGQGIARRGSWNKKSGEIK